MTPAPDSKRTSEHTVLRERAHTLVTDSAHNRVSQLVTAQAVRDGVERITEQNAALVSALRDAEFLMRKVAINWKEAGSMVDSFNRSAEDARAALRATEEEV